MTNIFIASLDCAGFLLLLLSEEQSFWVLECIVNELLPPDYYTHNLLGVHTDQRVLAHLVDEMFPDVSETLGKAGVELQVRAFIFIPYMIIFGRRGAAGESRQSVLYAPQSACMITIIAISLSAISCLRRSSPSICALKTYVCTHAVSPSQVLTVDWFMCILCTGLPTHTSLRLWDALFLIGGSAVFRVALSLFFMNRARILSVALSATTSAVSVQRTPVLSKVEVDTQRTPVLSKVEVGEATPAAVAAGPSSGSEGTTAESLSRPLTPTFGSMFRRTVSSGARSFQQNLVDADAAAAAAAAGTDSGSAAAAPGHAHQLSNIVVSMTSKAPMAGGSARRGSAGNFPFMSAEGGGGGGGSSGGSSASSALGALLGQFSLGSSAPPSGRTKGGERDTLAETAQRVLAALPAAAASIVTPPAVTPTASGAPAASASETPASASINENLSSSSNSVEGGKGGGALGASSSSVVGAPGSALDVHCAADDDALPLSATLPLLASARDAAVSTRDAELDQSSSPTAAAGAAATPTIAANGGTVRSHTSTFPAIFSMLKSLPAGAHDVSTLFSIAFPITPGEVKSLAAGYLPRDAHHHRHQHASRGTSSSSARSSVASASQISSARVSSSSTGGSDSKSSTYALSAADMWARMSSTGSGLLAQFPSSSSSSSHSGGSSGGSAVGVPNGSGFVWDAHVSPSRISRLRSAARAVTLAEFGESQATRAALAAAQQLSRAGGVGGGGAR